MPVKSKIAANGVEREPVTIEFTKRTVIGSVRTSEYGDVDIMSAFFDAVESDARDQMVNDKISVDNYEMTDELGTTKITVTHVPNSSNV